MRPGFLLQRRHDSGNAVNQVDRVSGDGQSHAEAQHIRANNVGGVSQPLDGQRAKELAWWASVFCITTGDFRLENELSSVITRLLAQKGYHESWKIKDLPLHLSVVLQDEADNLPRHHRLKSQLARDRYALFIWHGQASAGLPFLSACDWCGHPTGNFGDCCSKTWICTECEKEFEECRKCSTI